MSGRMTNDEFERAVSLAVWGSKRLVPAPILAEAYRARAEEVRQMKRADALAMAAMDVVREMGLGVKVGLYPEEIADAIGKLALALKGDKP